MTHAPSTPTSNAFSANDTRCLHRSPSGRRCPHAAKDSRSRFCPAHDAIQADRHNGSRTDYLLGQDNDLLSAREVNRSLAHLYFLLADDQISPRRAAVLAYISNLMVRTFPAVEKEEAPDSPPIILDLPPRPGDAPHPHHDLPSSLQDLARQHPQPPSSTAENSAGVTTPGDGTHPRTNS